MNKIMLSIALMLSIWFVGSKVEANCPAQQHGLVKPGDWVWVNHYGWCRVVSVGEPAPAKPKVNHRPKAPKLDDKGKTAVKPKEKANDKAKPKAPKFDDK